MEPPDILKEIVENMRCEVEDLKVKIPIQSLERSIEVQDQPLNLAGALWGDSVRIIAEVKKASPVKGILRADLDVTELSSAYADNGAAAISVLTNRSYFQGSLNDLKIVCGIAKPRRLPVLRKEFIFDPYQVYEARANGADAILLIVSMHTPASLSSLMSVARNLWLQVLVEIHDTEELRVALDAGAEIIGINNRNLRTFDTDLAVTEKIAPLIPKDKIIVSESGIANRGHIGRLKNAGAQAALIGESLVASADPGSKLRELA